MKKQTFAEWILSIDPNPPHDGVAVYVSKTARFRLYALAWFLRRSP